MSPNLPSMALGGGWGLRSDAGLGMAWRRGGQGVVAAHDMHAKGFGKQDLCCSSS